MDLSPGFDQPALGCRHVALQALDGVDREDGCMLLVERVKVRSVMLRARFNEHANNNPEEPRKFRHG